LNNNNQMAQKIIMIIPLLMIIGGIAVFLVTVGLKIYDSVFISNAVPVNATCTYVWRTVSSNDDGDESVYYYHANVTYEYEGKTYTAENVDVNEGATVGSLVRVYVNPNSPKNARQPMTTSALVTGIFVAIVLEAVGILIFKKMSPKNLNAPVSFNDSLYGD